ncbi:shikimate dehydrogenase [Neobacillus sp. SM06]|uniref:shikimate dehydrogenase n=1 Tax=Neobacillus sp. SM06 TaxID=3422492 RepID=UPI003D2D675F
MKKLFAVLGDPIAHSMSPAMHNDLFAHYRLEAEYLPFQVQKENLKDAVKGLKALGAAGFNVTVPHKSAILPFLDEIDELALSIGAVNTVVNRSGKLVGYNTDGLGFIKGLETFLPQLANKKALVIGAGGAARAIYFSLAQLDCLTIDLANRTVQKAEELIRDCPFTNASRAFSLDEAAAKLGDYDLLIQTTSIGMHPNSTEQPLRLDRLGNKAVVCDIIYNPLYTQFLQQAKQRGATVQNGLEMFVYQGALAFEKWTGIFPDIQRMKTNVLQQLRRTLNVNR